MPDPISSLANYAHPCSEIAKIKLEQPNELRKAHRVTEPIYKVLLRELYQDGCYTAAHHFECLVDLERKLIAKEHERHYVYENPAFLVKLIENVKAAEQIYRLDKEYGIYTSRRILNQIMRFVEKESFQWLTLKLYDILCEIMLKPTDVYLAKEQSARFIFRYSKYLVAQGTDVALQQATKVLPIAIDLSSGEAWKPDASPEDEHFPTLYAALCSLLGEIYLIKAKLPGITRKRAMKRMQKGLKAIAKVGPGQNKYLTFKGLLVKIDLLIDASRFDWALRELRFLEKSLMKLHDPEYVPYQLDLLLKLGIAHYNLDHPDTAITCFSKALRMCRFHNHIEAEGEILLHVGQAQRRLPDGLIKARLAFQLAKTHFQLHGDYEKANKVKYQIALLKSDLISQDLFRIIQSKKYCDFYKLRQWKNLCIPFWQDGRGYGHLTQKTINSISMFKISNLYRLYNLILNDQASFISVTEKTESSSTDENIITLEHFIENNLYTSEADFDSEERGLEEECEWVSDDVGTTEGIELSDVTQRHVSIRRESARASSARASSARASSAKASSARSSSARRSTPIKKVWLPTDDDSLICLLQEV